MKPYDFSHFLTLSRLITVINGFVQTFIYINCIFFFLAGMHLIIIYTLNAYIYHHKNKNKQERVEGILKYFTRFHEGNFNNAFFFIIFSPSFPPSDAHILLEGNEQTNE